MKLRTLLQMGAALLALAFVPTRADAQFAVQPDLKGLTFSLDVGTSVVLTSGERQEFAVARATLTAPLPFDATAFARGELSGNQDGGSLNKLEPDAFRSFEGVVGIRRTVYGPLSVGPIFAITYSAEGAKDGPLKNRHYTLGGTLSVRIRNGYLHLGAANHDPAGGGAFVGGASIPTSKAVTSVDAAIPFQANPVTGKRGYVVRVNATVRVKDFR